VAKTLEQATKTGLEQILAETAHVGKKVNGWQITITGKYGTDYLFRAATALVGLGANLPQDALYPLTTIEGNGRQLNGTHKYEGQAACGEWLLVVNDVQRRVFFC